RGSFVAASSLIREARGSLLDVIRDRDLACHSCRALIVASILTCSSAPHAEGVNSY
ncbi:unnamed protein product, partial [Musa acuminata var. zebrina]